MSPLAAPPSASYATLVWRRFALFGPALAIAMAGWWLAWQMIDEVNSDFANILDLLAFFVFSLLFLMLSLSAWAAILGLGLWFGGRRLTPLEREALAIPRERLVPSQASRTALLIPAYHEDPVEVFARVRAMHASLAALQPRGMDSDIDIFVLSDSQEAGAIKAEAREYKACVAALGKHGPTVYYRRRADNAEYKVGNIKEFCTRWGNAYEHMLVLDADSLMAGETIRRMIVLMERHIQIGLLQTSFIPVGRETLFCRVMHFSTRLYLMPAAMGLEFWQGPCGNYWGHNALIRTRAFAETCGLPELPGKAPLGGRILSHDIVEAAFLARGGWESWLLPNLPGTYEELPTNLIDFMQRDRRWCAGNLQHQHIIRADGVRFVNRLHMLLGIMSYAAGPLWLAFILVTLLGTFLDADSAGLHLATAGLFSPSEEGTMLARLTLALLFGPKLVTLGLALVRSEVRKGFGGGMNLIAGAVLEQLFVVLQQPAVMLFYTTFFMKPLFGTVVKWEAQPRSERGISWTEAFRRHRNHLLLGSGLMAAITLLHCTPVLLGLAPVLGGLFLSPAFTVLTSRTDLGLLMRRLGLFLTPDELMPDEVIRRVQIILAEPKARTARQVKMPPLPAEMHCAMPTQLLRYPHHSVRGLIHAHTVVAEDGSAVRE